MRYLVYRTLSFVALSCRYFDLNQARPVHEVVGGAKVGAMPKHSEYFCNEELGQKTKTWVRQNLVGGALVHQALNPNPHKLVLFLLLGVGKILIMLRHNSGFPALIRRKITLSMGFIT